MMSIVNVVDFLVRKEIFDLVFIKGGFGSFV